MQKVMFQGFKARWCKRMVLVAVYSVYPIKWHGMKLQDASEHEHVACAAHDNREKSHWTDVDWVAK